MTQGSEHPPLGAESVGAFLSALAGASPAPGGGAAAALTGALAAALVAMVGRVTAARDATARGTATALAERADELRARLTDLMTEDARAYRRVLEVRRAAEGRPAVEEALARATAVPLAVARGGREILELGESLAPMARASALADLGVATALAAAALESAGLTARANLLDAPDRQSADASEAELAELLDGGRRARDRASALVARRLRRPD